MSEFVEIELPYPPSVNHYWKHTKQGRHYISPKGKAYQSQVFVACLGHLPFQKPVAISVDVYLPDNRKRDLDNLWKVLLDSLVNAQIVADDCWQYLPKLSIEAKGIEKGGRIVVRMEECKNEQCIER
ncbi:hypothetical protein A4G19_13080 [Pasteurellaceae bacterium Macca]|nr:hypothetical protein [Pasteurellaceae bacterium Macca]MCK3656427.1 hypothetical protein [Pasteurellaceae bacterium Macca]MCK3656628.1 hypothetical protein [Pasteurellaceae bacterium Macca]